MSGPAGLGMEFVVADAAADRLRGLLRPEHRDRAALAPEPDWLAGYIADGGGLREVLGLLDWAGAAKLRPPLAGVAPAALDAGESRGGRTGSVQRVTVSLAAVVVVAAPDDPGGARARRRGDLGRHVAAVRAALLGWTPPAAGGGRTAPLAFRAGRLLEIADGRVAWEDRYETVCWIAGGAGLAPARRLMEGETG